MYVLILFNFQYKTNAYPFFPPEGNRFPLPREDLPGMIMILIVGNYGNELIPFKAQQP